MMVSCMGKTTTEISFAIEHAGMCVHKDELRYEIDKSSPGRHFIRDENVEQVEILIRTFDR